MTDYKKLGKELVDSVEIQPKRRVTKTEELFPYIYAVSKKGMSGRAISDWLSKRGAAVSFSTVSKALREKDDYFRVWFERFNVIEKELHYLKRENQNHDIPFSGTCLFDETAFNEFVVIKNSFEAGYITDSGRYRELCRVIQNDWFDLPPEFREACKESIQKEKGNE